MRPRAGGDKPRPYEIMIAPTKPKGFPYEIMILVTYCTLIQTAALKLTPIPSKGELNIRLH
jgi:hypothetical protein